MARWRLAALLSLWLFSGLARPLCAADRQVRPPARPIVAATGEAADTGNAAAARRQALRSAARAAVAQTLAVLVDETTRAEKAGVIEERVLSRAGSFTFVNGVVRSVTLDRAYRVTAEFRVDGLRLAQALRQAGVLPESRVMVSFTEDYLSRPVPQPSSPERLVSALTAVGFHVLAPPKPGSGEEWAVRAARKAGVDLLILGRAVAARASNPAPGFIACRARLDARVLLADTGETVAVESGEAPAADLTEGTAARKALSQAGARVAPALVQDLLLLPSRSTRRVRLEVAGMESMVRVKELSKVLATLPGVAQVTFVSYEAGRATFEVDVAARVLAGLAAALEDREATKPFALEVGSESGFDIRAKLSEEAPPPAGG